MSLDNPLASSVQPDYHVSRTAVRDAVQRRSMFNLIH